jgi:uncharacterized protein
MMSRRSLFLALVFTTAVIVLVLDIMKTTPDKLPLEKEGREYVLKAPDEKGPLLAVVLDDFGYSGKNLGDLKRIGAPMTLAVLPGLRHSAHVSYFARENGMEVILHLPMEPEKKTAPLEKDTIMAGMEQPEIKKILERDIASVPGARGVSNHMGSKATGDRKAMDSIVSHLKDEGLFFLDSMTTGRTVAGEVAAEHGVPYVRRDIFIDNKLDVSYIELQIEKAAELAIERGSAIAIGHDRAETIEALSVAVPAAQKRGVRFVTLSELIEEKEKQR